MHRQRLILRAWGARCGLSTPSAAETRSVPLSAADVKSCRSPSATPFPKSRLDSRPLSTAAQGLAAEDVGVNVNEALPGVSTSELSADLVRAQERQKLDLLLHKMSDGVQRTGRILVDDLSRALDMLKRFSSCTSTQALLLIRSCGASLVDEPPAIRQERVENIWSFLERSSLKLDSSHYNALLQAKIDNGETRPPTDFLALMESRGIEPNRVTFQRLVDLYCQQNNVTQALTVLEHMKTQGLAINERVFQSLIIGHCKSGDLDQAKETMDMMKESGLDVGTEGYVLYILGMVENGRPWEEVNEVMQGNLREDDVTFDDSDFLRVVLALAKSKQSDEAKDLLQKIPKRSGYFQEARNMIPQLVFADALDVAMGLFESLNLATMDQRDDSGMFFLSALVKQQTPWEKLKPFMDQQFEKNHQRPGRYLEVCAQNGLIEYGKEIKFHLVQAYGEDKVLEQEIFDKYCRLTTMKAARGEDIVKYFGSLCQIDLPIPTRKFYKDFMERYFDAEPNAHISTGVDAFFEVAEQKVSWGLIANTAVMVFLNREAGDKFLEAAFFQALRVKSNARPKFIRASVARSYLATSDMESFLVFLETCKLSDLASKGDDRVMENYPIILESLEGIHRLSHRYREDLSADEVVGQVLEAMGENKLYLPGAVASSLKSIISNENVLTTIDKLVGLADEPLDAASLEQSIQRRRESILRRLKEARTGGRRQRQVSDYKSLTSDELREIHDQRFNSEQPVHNGILNPLFEKYYTERKHDEAFKLLVASGGEFVPRSQVLNAIINSQFSEENIDSIYKLTLACLDKKKQLPMLLIDRLVLRLRQPEDHEKLMTLLGHPEIVNSTKQEDVQMHKFAKLAEKIQEVKSGEQMDEVKNALAKVGVAMDSSVAMVMLTGTLEEAVAAFEKNAEETRTLVGKNGLYKRLIEEEKVDLMQRVLNTTSRIIGEHNAMYDLTTSFLEVGKVTQANKLLSSTGLRYNKSQVSRMFDALERTNPKAFDSIAVVTRNLVGCNRNHIFSALLDKWKREPAKVEELWLVMQEEDHVLSNNMKLKMADILSSSGRPVPFEVPQATAQQ